MKIREEEKYIKEDKDKRVKNVLEKQIKINYPLSTKWRFLFVFNKKGFVNSKLNL